MGSNKYSVVARACQGDIEAVENVLGSVYAPLFDLAFHYLADVEAAKTITHSGLKTLCGELMTNSLSAGDPFLAALRVQVMRLDEELPSSEGVWNDFFANRDPRACLAFLTILATSVRGDDLDFVTRMDEAEIRAEEILAAPRIHDDWVSCQTRFDEHAAGVRLPEGVVESIVDELEAAAGQFKAES